MICVTVLKSICPIAKPNSHIEFIPAVLTAIVIAIASLWENPQMPQAITVSDKLAHGVLYAVLAISMMAGVRRDARMRVRTYCNELRGADGDTAAVLHAHTFRRDGGSVCRCYRRPHRYNLIRNLRGHEIPIP